MPGEAKIAKRFNLSTALFTGNKTEIADMTLKL